MRYKAGTYAGGVERGDKKANDQQGVAKLKDKTKIFPPS